MKIKVATGSGVENFDLRNWAHRISDLKVATTYVGGSTSGVAKLIPRDENNEDHLTEVVLMLTPETTKTDIVDILMKLGPDEAHMLPGYDESALYCWWD